MIDYEFTIRRLERELAHYREMQQIEQSHVDAHDRSITALQEISDATREDIKEIVAMVKTLTVKMDTLTANVNLLVEALLRDHTDGSGR